MKKTTKDCTEPVDKTHYKKKYLVRKLEEHEAEQEIKEYEDRSNERDPDRFDGE